MITVTFVHEQETRNGKSRYSELAPGAILRSLYVSSDALRQEFGEIPHKLVMRIEEGSK